MSGLPSNGMRDPTRMALDEFRRWIYETPKEYQELRARLYGKPRVRVPVERQTPNEADL